MAQMIRNIRGTYHTLNVEWADPRVSDLLWMGSPLYPVLIIGSYVYFISSLGPQLMKNRKPFQIDRFIQIYNIFQIIINIYIFAQALSLGWATDYSWRCQPVDYSSTPRATEIARKTHLFFLVKVSDLLDTIFFVLKKKESHISFLHVYHHGGMVLGTWIGVKYFAGGHVTFIGLLNSIVHAVMYSYYLIMSIYPEYKRNAWWKKYITQMQMVQFLFIAVHSAQLFFSNPCNAPLIISLLLVPQNVFMLVLFADFYRKSYMKQKDA